MEETKTAAEFADDEADLANAPEGLVVAAPCFWRAMLRSCRPTARSAIRRNGASSLSSLQTGRHAKTGGSKRTITSSYERADQDHQCWSPSFSPRA